MNGAEPGTPSGEAETTGEFAVDVLAGLALPEKSIPPKYFYDRRGSQLFDKICALPEYYLTRTELEIMQAHAAEMGALLGPGARLVEYGSGSSLKIRLLLDHMISPASCVLVDISGDHLIASAEDLAAAYPSVQVQPLHADFTRTFDLPPVHGEVQSTTAYFPGSTIGNFSPYESLVLMRSMAGLIGGDGGVLIGIDLEKNLSVLLPAYNDAAGVTAAFNLNLLTRINRELGGDFDLDAFEHRAVYETEPGRIEMHLVSRQSQRVTVLGRAFGFDEGETILTERSHKYTLPQFAQLAAAAGLRVVETWEDPRGWFSVQYLRPVD